MSFVVGRIRNKFWNNASFKQPNCFPIYDEEQVIIDTVPSLTSDWSGIVYLTGDQWNHCRYQGIYYALYIQDVLDRSRKYYRYRLEREYWFDVLANKVKVTGDLSNSNNDELLEENLAKTIAVLDNPCEIIPINFTDADTDWRPSLVFKPSVKKFGDNFLLSEDIRRIKEALRGVKEVKLYEKHDEFYNKWNNPQDTILAVIKDKPRRISWKSYIKERVHEFCENIKKGITDPKIPAVKVGKVSTTISGKLDGNYCITYEEDGIASAREDIGIDVIDLSKLEDIVPISMVDLKPKKSDFFIYTENNYQIVDEKVAEDHFPCVKFVYGWIASFPKVPLNWYEADTAIPPLKYGHGFGFGNSNWAPTFLQKVDFEMSGIERGIGTFYLWWVPKLNFQVLSTFYEDYFKNTNTHVQRLYGSRLTRSNLIVKPSLTKLGPYNFPFSFGFQIFQVFPDVEQWRLYEYLGEETGRIKYISGLTREFFLKYSQRRYFEAWHNPKNHAPLNLQPGDYSRVLFEYYLYLYKLTWLSFMPSTFYPGYAYGYTNEDYFGHWRFVKQYYLEIAAKEPFPNEPAYFGNNTEYMNKFIPRLKEENKTNLEYDYFDLVDTEGKRRYLKKGDYFFSARDYHIVFSAYSDNFLESLDENIRDNTYQERRGFWSDFSDTYKEYRNNLLVKDFVNQINIAQTNISTNDFFLFMDCEGKISFREYYEYEPTLKVSEKWKETESYGKFLHPKITVFGNEKSKRYFFHLPKMVEYEGNDDDFIFKFLCKYYEKHHKDAIIDREKKTIKINWFYIPDFKPENNRSPLLFDLVGTEWYCLFFKGRVHLILKDIKSNVFYGYEKKTNTLNLRELERTNYSLLEKVNQKVKLQFYNKSFYLNWKFNFKTSADINFSFKVIDPEQTKSNFNEYFVSLRTGFDTIWHENVSVPKIRDKIAEFSDEIEIEKLHLQKTIAEHQYDLAKERTTLTEKRLGEGVRRAEQAFQLAKVRSDADISTKTTQAIGHSLTGLLSNNPIKGFFGPWIEYLDDVKTKTIDEMYKFPMIAKNIDMDKALNAEEIALRNRAIDLTYMDRQRALTIEANQLFNRYDNPNTSEIKVLKQFLENKSWHNNRVLKEQYMVIYLPTQLQLKYLEDIKNEYGIMCNIPNHEMYFYNEMKHDIIRFRNIDPAGVIGLDNNNIREAFIRRLLAGIHIVEVTPSVELVDINQLQRTVFLLSRQVVDTTKELSSKEGEIKLLETRVSEIAEETRKESEGEIERLKNECASTKSEFEKTIQRIENQLNNITIQLNQKVTELREKKRELENLKKNLEDEIKKHKIDKEAAEQKWDDCKRDYLNEKEAKNALLKEKENLENQKADIERQLRECLENKKKVEDKLEACRTEKGMGEVEPIEACQMLHQIIDPIVDTTLELDQFGLNSFTRLCLTLFQRLEIMRQTHMEQFLGKYVPMQALFGKLQEIQNFFVIDDISNINKDYRSKYINWVSGGGLTDEARNVKETILDINRRYSYRGNLLELKHLLDDSFDLAREAKKNLEEELKTDTELQFMFSHVFPNGIKEPYEELYGDIRNGIAIKKFKQVPCSDKSINPFGQLKTIIEETIHDFSDIPTFERGFPPDAFMFNGKRLGMGKLEDLETTLIASVTNEKRGEKYQPVELKRNQVSIVIKSSNFYWKGTGSGLKYAWSDMYFGPPWANKKSELYIRVQGITGLYRGDRPFWYQILHNRREFFSIWKNTMDNKRKEEILNFFKINKFKIGFSRFLPADYNFPNNLKAMTIKDSDINYQIIDLELVFGKRLWEVIIILTVLTQVGMFFDAADRSSAYYDDLPRIGATTHTGYWEQIFPKNLTPDNTKYFFQFEFKDMESLLEYVALCLNEEKILDPSDSKNGKMFRKLILDMYWCQSNS